MNDPIDALWLRLARLERCCAVSIESYVLRPEGQAGPSERHWRVVIRHPGCSATPIHVYRRTAREAIEDALARAEALGWPGSAQGGGAGAAGPGAPPTGPGGAGPPPAPPGEPAPGLMSIASPAIRRLSGSAREGA